MIKQQKEQIQIQTKKQMKLAGISAIMLLAAVLFLPHIHTGYTTHDDTRTAIEAWQTTNLFDRPFAKAKAQGRINHIVNTPIEWLPYLSQNKIIYQLFRLGGAFLPFLLFAWLVGFCSKSTALGFASGCLVLGLYQNNWQHNLLTAYPFCFQMGFCIVMLAFWCQYTACKQGRPFRAWLGAGCLLIAFFIYEAFFAYLPLVFFLTMIWRPFEHKSSLRTKFKSWWPYMFPVLGAASTFLIAYFAFRKLYPSDYTGLALSLASPQVFLRTLLQFIIGTFPTVFFFVDPYTFNQVSTGWEPFSQNIGFLLANLESVWVLKAGIFTAAMLFFLPIAARSQGKKEMTVTAITGLFMMVLPFVLISLTPKYQEWAKQGTLAYVPSYFAFFGTALMIVAALCFVYRRFPKRFWLNIVLGSLLFIAALLTGTSNYYYALDQKQSQLKWRIVDSFLTTSVFNTLPGGCVIIAPDLWEKRGILAFDHDPTYWSDYFTVKSGKRIKVVRSPKNLAGLETKHCDSFYFDLLRDHRHFSVAVLFAKLPNPLELSANELFLATAGPHRKYQIVGRFAETSERLKTRVWINNEPLKQTLIGNEFFSAWIDRFQNFKRPSGEELSHKTFIELVKKAMRPIFTTPKFRSAPDFPFHLTRVSSDHYMELQSFNISYQQHNKNLR